MKNKIILVSFLVILQLTVCPKKSFKYFTFLRQFLRKYHHLLSHFNLSPHHKLPLPPPTILMHCPRWLCPSIAVTQRSTITNLHHCSSPNIVYLFQLRGEYQFLLIISVFFHYKSIFYYKVALDVQLMNFFIWKKKCFVFQI